MFHTKGVPLPSKPKAQPGFCPCPEQAGKHQLVKRDPEFLFPVSHKTMGKQGLGWIFDAPFQVSLCRTVPAFAGT